MNNWKRNASSFVNYILQTGNPRCPVLRTFDTITSNTNFAYNYASGVARTRVAILEAYEEFCWGLWMNAYLDNIKCILSSWMPVDDYPSELNYGHVWTAWLPAAGNNAYTATMNFFCNTMLEFDVYFRQSDTGAFTKYSADHGNVDITVTPTTAGSFCQWAVFINTKGFQNCQINLLLYHSGSGNDLYSSNLCFVNTSAAALPSGFLDWPYNLQSIITTDFNYIEGRSAQVRKNCSSLVYTQSGAQLYRGGTVTCASLWANDPIPNSDYQAYLYTLPKTVMLDFSKGLTSCWWSSSGDYLLRPSAAFPINTLAAPNTSTVFAIVTNVAVSGQSNDSLQVQMKLHEWIDYATTDPTLNSVEVVAYNDEWARIMSYVAKEYQFTDNPNHKKYLDYLKRAISWMVSGDPRAVALRKAGAEVLGTLGGNAIKSLF
jgi:hypothetical protein